MQEGQLNLNKSIFQLFTIDVFLSFSTIYVRAKLKILFDNFFASITDL